jgi:hypothetical protein
MARTACLVCLISTVSGCCKKAENALEDVVLVAGTQQNLSNLFSLDIYGTARLSCFKRVVMLQHTTEVWCHKPVQKMNFKVLFIA